MGGIPAGGLGTPLLLFFSALRYFLLDPLDRPLGEIGGEVGIGDEGDDRAPFVVIDLVLDQAASGTGRIRL